MGLRRYTIAREYGTIYEHNFQFVQSLEREQLFARLADYLSSVTAIERRIIAADLKRHILTANELFFRSFSAQPLYLVFVVPSYIIACFYHMPWSRPVKKADVIVDDWSRGVVERFYGNELRVSLQARCTTAYMPFARSGHINLRLFLTTFIPFLRSLAAAWRIYFKYRVNLASYLRFFFSSYLQGDAFGRQAGPKFIISGNDNGFPVIKAKAAKAKIMLIQNGLRPVISDSCFKYADYYVSLEDTEMRRVRREKTGCVFDTILPFGSLYLHNGVDKNRQYETRYDILYASTVHLGSAAYEKQYGHWYPLACEREVLKALNALAERSGLRIAYKCRYAGETEDIRRYGLASDKITYIPQDRETVYEVILQSKLLLASMSTTVWEAILLGRKSACINVSGNDYLNYYYQRFHNEYTPASGISFEEFIMQILARAGGFDHDGAQNPAFIRDIVSLVAEGVQHAG